MKNTDTIEIKHYSHKELSVVYGVSDKTLHKWMKPFIEDIGKKQGRYYTIAQVEIIFARLGMPH
jgi:hypothetical protein